MDLTSQEIDFFVDLGIAVLTRKLTALLAGGGRRDAGSGSARGSGGMASVGSKHWR